LIFFEEDWLESIGDDQVETGAPIFTQSSFHYKLHIFPMTICGQENELALLPELFKNRYQFWLRYHEFSWVFEGLREKPAICGSWKNISFLVLVNILSPYSFSIIN